MKRSGIVLTALAVIAVAAAVSAYMLTRPALLVSMSSAYGSAAYKLQEALFEREANGRVKFNFKSNIESGNLTVAVYDSNGEEVFNLGRAKELQTNYTFGKTDTYTLRAVCDSFVGNYEVTVTDAD